MAVDTITTTLRTASVGRPITRAGVSLFPVYLHQEHRVDYLPGVVALDDGLVEFGEVGEVANLHVVSRATRPILFPEGDTVVGGLQNRTLNVTVLVAAGTATVVPVSCVEEHRWGRGTRFAHGGSLTPRRVRRAKVASVSERVAVGAGRRSDQGAVWDTVDDAIHLAAVEAPTAAVHDAIDEMAGRLAELRRVGPLPGQHGVVVSLGRRVVAAEIFDRPDTLAAYWPALIDGYALDAGDTPEGRPSATRALGFLADLARIRPVENPGVGLGTELHVLDAGIAATGLRVDDTLIHLSAFAT